MVIFTNEWKWLKADHLEYVQVSWYADFFQTLCAGNLYQFFSIPALLCYTHQKVFYKSLPWNLDHNLNMPSGEKLLELKFLIPLEEITPQTRWCYIQSNLKLLKCVMHYNEIFDILYVSITQLHFCSPEYKILC